ncbi:MAG TPA: hypothetical protein VJ552_01155 [Sediminibacterium sp.]|nr:hypothetical protein [Sediminibacterium sp.]
MNRLPCFYLLCFFAFTSCAKIPVQSLTLAESITREGKRMHELNIALLNSIYQEKRQKINDFIRNDYTPWFSNEIVKNIKDSIQLKNDLPLILSKALPVLSAQIADRQTALEASRALLLDQLNADFLAYQASCNELTYLLESAVKLDEARKKLMTRVADVSGNKIDFDSLNLTLDRFIADKGDLGQNIDALNKAIRKLIKP